MTLLKYELIGEYANNQNVASACGLISSNQMHQFKVYFWKWATWWLTCIWKTEIFLTNTMVGLSDSSERSANIYFWCDEWWLTDGLYGWVSTRITLMWDVHSSRHNFSWKLFLTAYFLNFALWLWEIVLSINSLLLKLAQSCPVTIICEPQSKMKIQFNRFSSRDKTSFSVLSYYAATASFSPFSSSFPSLPPLAMVLPKFAGL